MNYSIRRLHHKQRGSTLVLVSVFVVAVFAFAALSLDVANVYREQRKTNYGTDAGALAGVIFLTNQTQNVTAAKTRALAIAAANGVTAAEISNAGTVEVGYWDISNRTFSVSGTGRFNAVRVPGRRNVPMNFAQIVGTRDMNPSVRSVAAIGSAGNSMSIIPFGIGESLLVGKDFVTNNIVTISSQSAGNWGKLDIGGQNSCGPCFVYAMENAANGQGTPASVGDEISPGTGSAQLVNGFSAVIGQTVVVPVVQTFNVGNHDVTVTGFVLAIPLSASGGGQNIQITMQLIRGFTGSGIGGPTTGPYAMSRALVQ